jgi:hypothetical protein
MKNSEYNGSSEYRKAIHFLELGCVCGCSKKITRESFAELREAFQALSKSEQDIYLMAQLKAMNGGEITASRHLKKKTRTNVVHGFGICMDSGYFLIWLHYEVSVDQLHG